MSKIDKIERAIRDVRFDYEAKERELLICKTQLQSLYEQLQRLQAIQDDDSIPYEVAKSE
jgi:hypothetical protein